MRFIGIAELIGAVGLILPSALRIQPRLSALAAAGLVLVMVLGSVFHLTRGENFAPPLVLFALSTFVAYGRWKLAPIAPKSAPDEQDA